jgi:hypothetical protein
VTAVPEPACSQLVTEDYPGLVGQVRGGSYAGTCPQTTQEPRSVRDVCRHASADDPGDASQVGRMRACVRRRPIEPKPCGFIRSADGALIHGATSRLARRSYQSGLRGGSRPCSQAPLMGLGATLRHSSALRIIVTRTAGKPKPLMRQRFSSS